eukprot:Clim_evm44s136 gene=Clim_evmTU44s136
MADMVSMKVDDDPMGQESKTLAEELRILPSVLDLIDALQKNKDVSECNKAAERVADQFKNAHRALENNEASNISGKELNRRTEELKEAYRKRAELMQSTLDSLGDQN